MTEYAMRLAQPANLLLLPVLLAQGGLVRRRTPRLPEAEADTGLVAGSGPVLRLAVLGDSLAAGVGVAHNSAGLAGQLAARVAASTGRAVSWRVAARTGATALSTARELTGRLVDPSTRWRPDIVVVSVGINDLLAYRRVRAWRADLTALLHAVRSRVGAAVPVLALGIPPLRRFPALPQPLRGVFAVRAGLMDRVLARTCAGLDVGHVPLPAARISDSTEFFATDRFHPSAVGYRELAAELTAPVLARVPAARGA